MRRGIPRRSIAGSLLLPSSYNFELQKTVSEILRRAPKRVSLQFPDGLKKFALPISDIIKSNTPVEDVVILADVTYGACCVDDITTSLIDSDLLIHYGHSCLIPITECNHPILYIFVEIQFDTAHCVEMVQKVLSSLPPSTSSVSLLGTIQYVRGVERVRKELRNAGIPTVDVPRILPLSKGEVLGCTSPPISSSVTIFVSDGRFHMESAMIRNPLSLFFKYCPSSLKMTRESYDYKKFLSIRMERIEKAKNAQKFGIIFGTLGRQGTTSKFLEIRNSLRKRGRKFYNFLISELDSRAIARMEGVLDCLVEIACPRLCLDWGYSFSIPIVTPYEYFVSSGEADPPSSFYPMDYYAAPSPGSPH